ncbi:type III-A CRISPR-associated protein Csm2 [Clostridium felsineum]|uniref:type III-A CRISPR-associated protein Csm2 n=1 Tax=Clostridium felsineum TaxID=36839 RepID=UPI00098C5964|nr:type III-A CRISPR-associated protein Csm2 [Clostridium felsineum]URZ03976.1 hypothetical protein CLAUR_040420 [Clostridium felsineum]
MGKRDNSTLTNESCNRELYQIIKILKTSKSYIDNNKINMEIVNQVENAAKNLSNNKVTGTSIRNIYNAFKDIEMKINQNYLDLDECESEEGLKEELNNKLNENFLKNKPIIKLLQGKIKYLIQRKIKQKSDYKKICIYEGLYEFIKESINVICEANDVEEFTAFLKVFEAMYGYLEKGGER